MSTVFTPAPVPARCCGVILQATFAADYDFLCPICSGPVCYTCGCTDASACVVEVATADGSRRARYACRWAAPACCTHCFARAAYEFYQEATGRAADDPYYLGLGRSARAVLGLAHVV